MAWTTPRTWLAGELVKEVDLNAQLRDNLNVLATAINTANGKIAGLSGTYLDNLDGTALTGIAKIAGPNTFTGGVHDFNGGAGARLVLPVGADKWAT
jgi:hypothetical protein